jgi:hypothetical protein
LPGKNRQTALLHHLAIYQRLVICAVGPPSRPPLCRIALRRYAVKFALSSWTEGDQRLLCKQFSVASTVVEAHLRNKFSDFVLFLSILCRRFNNRAWYSYEVALIINFSLKAKSILSL